MKKRLFGLLVVLVIMLCMAFITPITASASSMEASISGAGVITEGEIETYSISTNCKENVKVAVIQIQVTSGLELVSGEWKISGNSEALDKNNVTPIILSNGTTLNGNIYTFKVKGVSNSESKEKITVTVNTTINEEKVSAPASKNLTVKLPSSSSKEESTKSTTETKESQVANKSENSSKEVTAKGTKGNETSVVEQEKTTKETELAEQENAEKEVISEKKGDSETKDTKNKTTLIVGICAVAVLVLAAVILFITRKKK